MTFQLRTHQSAGPKQTGSFSDRMSWQSYPLPPRSSGHQTEAELLDRSASESWSGNCGAISGAVSHGHIQSANVDRKLPDAQSTELAIIFNYIFPAQRHCIPTISVLATYAIVARIKDYECAWAWLHAGIVCIQSRGTINVK